MNIRRAVLTDMDGINKLLHQVLMVHHNGRPDIFKPHAKKYTDEELAEIIADDTTPIFVAVDEQEHVLGYAFCIFKQMIDDHILTDIKTLYPVHTLTANPDISICQGDRESVLGLIVAQ